jgi:hypothetical protein
MGGGERGYVYAYANFQSMLNEIYAVPYFISSSTANRGFAIGKEHLLNKRFRGNERRHLI